VSDLRPRKTADPIGPSLICPECRQIYLVPQVGEAWRWTVVDYEGLVTRSPVPGVPGRISIATPEGLMNRNIHWKDLHHCPEWVFVKKA
jgi:hypothetical protein